VFSCTELHVFFVSDISGAETRRKLGNANPSLPNSPCNPPPRQKLAAVSPLVKLINVAVERATSSKPVPSFTALTHGTRYPAVLMLRNTLLIGFQTPPLYIRTHAHTRVHDGRSNKSEIFHLAQLNF
jgi:hypothetical protein